MRKKTKEPRRIAVCDCETDPFAYGREPRPFLWGFTDGKVYRDFTSTEELAKHVAQFDGIVYAHNGGKFDFHFLFDYITPHTEILIINGRVAKAMIGKAELRDSYCILPIALAEYQKTVIDYTKFEAAVRHLHMAEIQSYLRDDCNFLLELVVQFVAEYGDGITLASSAMRYWKGMGNDVPESDKRYYDIMSPWYAGGRVQCFAAGEVKKSFNLVDINSAYPYAMMHAHPYSCGYDVIAKPTDKTIKGASLYRIVGIAKGSLPYRDSDGALTFPEDDEEREYHCTGWELKAAVETKTVKVLEITERIDFGELKDFRGYIRHFYELKKNSKKGTPVYIFAKLFMNSLYGKFAADPSSYKNFAIVPPQELPEWTDGKYKAEGIGKLCGPWGYAGNLGQWAMVTNSKICMRDDGSDEQNRSKFYNVATGASITGFVRAYLWRHICAVRKAGGFVLYCDTDSLAFTFPAGEKIPFGLSKELGDWTHEGTFDYAAIGGKKLYAFRMDDATWDAHRKPDSEPDDRWKTACKGVSLTPAEIVKIAKGGEVTHKREAPSMRVGATGSVVNFISRTVRKTAGLTADAKKARKRACTKKATS